MIRPALACAAFLLFTQAALAQAPDAPEPPAPAADAAIRAAVMDYFEGGNDGQADRVARAFAGETGHMYVLRPGPDGDGLEARNLGEFAQVFSRPIPYERSGEILHLNIVDDRMAFAHLRFTTPDREYDDFFLLYRVNGEWKIVSKAFTVEPLETPED